MAEDDAEPTDDEAAELEALLDATPDEAGGGGEAGAKGLIAKVTSSKKMMIIVGGGVLLLLLLIGGAAYYFLLEKEVVEEVVTEEVVEEVEEVKQVIKKVHLYPLKTFFLPVKLENEEESGRFLSVSPSLLLSNPSLNKEIDKVLPLVRKNIYSILRRKSHKDLIEKNQATQERVKREILTASNALLLSGTGTIRDVYFSEFIVK